MTKAGWPTELDEVFESAITCAYASLTKDGRPITWPLTPYVGEGSTSIDVSTGITYPAKAERARRDPRVALLFSDPVGTKLEKPPVVYVRGHAAVRDRDLQGGADRYVRETLNKLAPAYRGAPWIFLKRQKWYWVRIWVHITPLEILWWPKGDLDADPERWERRSGELPQSDPAPKGRQPGSYQEVPDDWRPRAARAIGRLRHVDFTVVGDDGWPFIFRTRRVKAHPRGFVFRVGKGCPIKLAGPACITFHTHPEKFKGQENASFVGNVVQIEDDEAVFEVDRVLSDFSLPVGPVRGTAAFLGKARKLRPRFVAEIARRDQPIPVVRRRQRK